GIMTDANMRTNVPDVFAIGDIRGGMMLAHAAVFEGKRALNAILADEAAGAIPGTEGFADRFVREPVADGIDLDIIPAAVFTDPEVAVVGLTEEDCKAKGIEYKCLKSFFRANGKAVAMGEPEGCCKIIISDTGQILGCHIFGAHASDIVQEIVALMARKATIEDLRAIVH
ncbi:dihydrolipoyl dehydrogenase, partial [gut metagenome]